MDYIIELFMPNTGGTFLRAIRKNTVNDGSFEMKRCIEYLLMRTCRAKKRVNEVVPPDFHNYPTFL